MKIDDIIRKCIEIPGISIQRSDFSTELLLKEKEGKGSMTFFPLFPGVRLDGEIGISLQRSLKFLYLYDTLAFCGLLVDAH